MLSPDDFFDLSDFRHRALFDGLQYVWEALPRIEAYVRQHLIPRIDGEVLPGAWLGEHVYIGKGTLVESGAMIRGPAIIGEDCEIRSGAYVRENVLLGDRAVVGHASEVKNSVLLNAAKAPHFNYVGDSLLGCDINLGAGTILSNLKVTWTNIVVTIEGREYDTGLLKFGAIVGDHAETGCNCVCNPGTLIGKHSLVYPCTSVRGYIPPHSLVKLRQEMQVVERRPE